MFQEHARGGGRTYSGTAGATMAQADSRRSENKKKDPKTPEAEQTAWECRNEAAEMAVVASLGQVVVTGPQAEGSGSSGTSRALCPFG
jgi:hypothetical protein